MWLPTSCPAVAHCPCDLGQPFDVGAALEEGSGDAVARPECRESRGVLSLGPSSKVSAMAECGRWPAPNRGPEDGGRASADGPRHSARRPRESHGYPGIHEQPIVVRSGESGDNRRREERKRISGGKRKGRGLRDPRRELAWRIGRRYHVLNGRPTMARPRIFSSVGAFQLPTKEALPTVVYVGANTGVKAKGIYLFRFQPEGDVVRQNVTLVPLGVAVETPNPTFFELDLKRKLLFTVNEVDQFDGKPTGAVSAFSIDPKGKLALLNQRSSMGTGPSHLTLDKDGRDLLVANSHGGSIAVLPVASDGKLG